MSLLNVYDAISKTSRIYRWIACNVPSILFPSRDGEWPHNRVYTIPPSFFLFSNLDKSSRKTGSRYWIIAGEKIIAIIPELFHNCKRNRCTRIREINNPSFDRLFFQSKEEKKHEEIREARGSLNNSLSREKFLINRTWFYRNKETSTKLLGEEEVY